MAGSIETRTLGNGERRYKARFRPPGGKEVSQTFLRRGDAKEWLAQQAADHARGVWVDPRAGRTRFGEHAARVLEDRVHVRISTAGIDERNLRLHILPTFGDRPLRSINRRAVQSWVSSLTRAGLAPWTVRSVYSTFTKVLHDAVLDGLIPRSPCQRIDLPEVAGKVTIPTNRQLVIVERRLPPRWRRALAVAKCTGMRGGELFGLTADRVDFLRREIVVDRQLQRLPALSRRIAETGELPAQYRDAVRVGGSDFFLVSPKSKRSTRVVPVGRRAVEVLAAQIEEFPPDPELGLFFRTARGTPVSRAARAAGWERATRKRSARDLEAPDPGEKDGARDPELEPYFTFHDARHLYASLLISKGIGVTRVAACLGDTTEVVLRTYAHLWPDDEHAAREAVDEELDVDDDVVLAIAASTRPRRPARVGRGR